MDNEYLIWGLHRQFFKENVLSVIERYDNSAWMWWCSDVRKRIILEHGAIQPGYTDYDDDVKIYV